MPRTNLVNAVDVELAVAVAAPDLTITVDTAVPLPPVPFYLVIDPFNDTQGREYMLCTGVAAEVLTVTRSLAGSDSDVHDVGDVVRITIAAQHIDDLWTDIEAIPPQTFLHADLSDVASLPSAHHPRYIDSEAVEAMGAEAEGNPLNHLRYTDAEAVAAVGTVPPPQTFLHADLTDTGVADHHARYDDAEAIAAVGPHTAPQTFLHADLTDAASLPSAHHTKYLDSDAIAAVGPHTSEPIGVFLPLAGGTIVGETIVNGVPFQLVGDSIGLSIFGAPSNPLNGYRIFKTGIQLHIFSEDRGSDIALFTSGAGGQMNMYGRMLVVNDAGIGSGFMEPFAGAGRHVVRYGAGATSADGNFWQVIGPLDTSPEQVAFRFSVAGGAGQPYAATIARPGYTDMPVNATQPGAGTFSNISFSMEAPVGGISGDVHLRV